MGKIIVFMPAPLGPLESPWLNAGFGGSDTTFDGRTFNLDGCLYSPFFIYSYLT